jgi:hypothetical protein
MQDYSEYKKIMKAIGIPILIIGIILAIFGWISFGSGGIDNAALSGIMFIGGAFIAMVGFVLLRLAFIRPVSKYYATEMSPAMKITGQSIGDGLKESRFSTPQTKEIIKVKCPHCSYLESEDAEFCSKCGKKI